MKDLAYIGHNNPPTPMEVCASDHDAAISEAQNWGDGDLVADEAQMNAVDAIIKDLKTYRGLQTPIHGRERGGYGGG